jgi:hypothetical protein
VPRGPAEMDTGSTDANENPDPRRRQIRRLTRKAKYSKTVGPKGRGTPRIELAAAGRPRTLVQYFRVQKPEFMLRSQRKALKRQRQTRQAGFDGQLAWLQLLAKQTPGAK